MRIVFAGTPAVALPSLDAIAASGHDLMAVITRPDAPQGRSRRPVPSPVAQWADERGIETLRPTSQREPAFAARLRELAPDCCPIVAYGALIPGEVLAIPRLGWVNVHFSLLPAWRGAAPVQRAILAGDSQTGISIFDLVAALDAGPIYLREASQLAAAETSGQVLARLAERGADRLLHVLDALAAGTATATPQPTAGVTLAPKLTVAEARIDWNRSAAEIDRQVRACNPNPVAWTTFRGTRFKVWLGRPLDGQSDPGVAAEPSARLAPGVISVARSAVTVGTGDGTLRLLQVQPAGKRTMPAADWGRGVAADPGWFE